MKASKSFANWYLVFCWVACLSGGCSPQKNNAQPVVEVREVREVEYGRMGFRSDGFWYVRGENLPFSGKAIRRHDNGGISWITELDKGVPRGRVRQFSPDGAEIWPGTN